MSRSFISGVVATTVVLSSIAVDARKKSLTCPVRTVVSVGENRWEDVDDQGQKDDSPPADQGQNDDSEEMRPPTPRQVISNDDNTWRDAESGSGMRLRFTKGNTPSAPASGQTSTTTTSGKSGTSTSTKSSEVVQVDGWYACAAHAGAVAAKKSNGSGQKLCYKSNVVKDHIKDVMGPAKPVVGPCFPTPDDSGCDSDSEAGSSGMKLRYKSGQQDDKTTTTDDKDDKPSTDDGPVYTGWGDSFGDMGWSGAHGTATGGTPAGSGQKLCYRSGQQDDKTTTSTDDKDDKASTDDGPVYTGWFDSFDDMAWSGAHGTATGGTPAGSGQKLCYRAGERLTDEDYDELARDAAERDEMEELVKEAASEDYDELARDAAPSPSEESERVDDSREVEVGLFKY